MIDFMPPNIPRHPHSMFPRRHDSASSKVYRSRVDEYYGYLHMKEALSDGSSPLLLAGVVFLLPFVRCQ